MIDLKKNESKLKTAADPPSKPQIIILTFKHMKNSKLIPAKILDAFKNHNPLFSLSFLPLNHFLNNIKNY